MDSGYMVMIGFLGLLLALCVGFLSYYVAINVLNPEGKGAEKKTARILQKFAMLRGFKVLSGLEIQVDGKTAHVENMLIGYFGILMVHTCGRRGEYYGTLEGAQWKVVLDQNSHAFPNPLLEQERAAVLLRSRFSKENLYKIPIEHVVYLSSRSNKTGLFITNSGEIIMPRKLGAYLGKTKFEKDTGLDVQKVADAVLRASGRESSPPVTR